MKMSHRFIFFEGKCHIDVFVIFENEYYPYLVYYLFSIISFALRVIHFLISMLKYKHVLENQNKKYFHRVNIPLSPKKKE